MKNLFQKLLLTASILYLLPDLSLPRKEDDFDRNGFGQLPVLVGGRLKPMDSVARNSLMIIHGKQTLVTRERSLSATHWLMDVMMHPEVARDDDLFVIDHSDVVGMFGWEKTKKKHFSYAQLEPHIPEIERQARLADAVVSQERSGFQSQILKLQQRIELYERLKNTLRIDEDTDLVREIELFEGSIEPGRLAAEAKAAKKPFDPKILEISQALNSRYEFLAQSAYVLPIPPERNESARGWTNIGQCLLQRRQGVAINPVVRNYAAMVGAYRTNDPFTFERALSEAQAAVKAQFPDTCFRARYEFRFNHFEPFYKCMTLYVLVFILVCFAWLGLSPSLQRGAYLVLFLAFVIHSCGLVSRMYLQGRPPVTNLYSSAVFIGWGVVLLGLILEKIYKDGVGSVTASILGFTTLLIAHHLSVDGDTMEMLRAVLDTNFWLATHVVAITLGYAATFLAGFLAILYIFRGLFTRSLDKKGAQSLTRMVYGIVCFATLFSFVGTILGGIWADQSWGRFWGWDPKENGALLIVLWNAIILHARWGGMIKSEGFMVMAVFGNIVTSFSWFGVNMLGVGLHSYGFMDKAFFWLALFVASQLGIMLLGALPVNYWRSFANLKR